MLHPPPPLPPCPGKKDDIIEKLQAEIHVTKADNTKLTEEIERLKMQIQQGSSSSVVAGALAPLLKVGGTSPTLKRDDDEVCLTNVSATLFARLFLPSSVL